MLTWWNALAVSHSSASPREPNARLEDVMWSDPPKDDCQLDHLMTVTVNHHAPSHEREGSSMLGRSIDIRRGSIGISKVLVCSVSDNGATVNSGIDYTAGSAYLSGASSAGMAQTRTSSLRRRRGPCSGSKHQELLMGPSVLACTLTRM